MTIKCDLTQRIEVQCKLRLLRGGFSNTVIVLKHGDKKEGLGERIYSVSLSSFFCWSPPKDDQVPHPYFALTLLGLIIRGLSFIHSFWWVRWFISVKVQQPFSPKGLFLLQFRPFFSRLWRLLVLSKAYLTTCREGEELLCGSEKSAFAKYFSLGL